MRGRLNRRIRADVEPPSELDLDWMPYTPEVQDEDKADTGLDENNLDLTPQDLDPVLDIPVSMYPGLNQTGIGYGIGVPSMTQFASFVPRKSRRTRANDAVTTNDKAPFLPVDTARDPEGFVPDPNAPVESMTVPVSGPEGGTVEIPSVTASYRKYRQARANMARKNRLTRATRRSFADTEEFIPNKDDDGEIGFDVSEKKESSSRLSRASRSSYRRRANCPVPPCPGQPDSFVPVTEGECEGDDCKEKNEARLSRANYRRNRMSKAYKRSLGNMDGVSDLTNPEPAAPETGDEIFTPNLNDEPVNEVPADPVTASRRMRHSARTRASRNSSAGMPRMFTPVLSNLDGEADPADPEPESERTTARYRRRARYSRRASEDGGDSFVPDTTEKVDESSDNVVEQEAKDEERAEELAEINQQLDEVKSDLEEISVTEPFEKTIELAQEALEQCQTETMVASAHVQRKLKGKRTAGIGLLADNEEAIEDAEDALDEAIENLEQLSGDAIIDEAVETVSGIRKKLLRTKANMQGQRKRKASANTIVDDNAVVIEEVADELETVESDIQEIKEACNEEAQPVINDTLEAIQTASLRIKRVKASMKNIIRASESEDKADDNVTEALDKVIEQAETVIDTIDQLKDVCQDAEATAHLNKIMAKMTKVKADAQSIVEDVEISDSTTNGEDLTAIDKSDEPIMPESDVDVSTANNLVMLSEEIPEQVDAEEVCMTLHATASANPFWNLTLAGIPVARICLADQEDPEGVKDTFVSQDYEDTVTSAIASYGTKKTLRMVRARPYAYKIQQSSIARQARDRADKKAQASIEKAQASMLDKLLYATTVVTAGLTKNFFKGANRPLHHAIFMEAQANGVYNPAGFTEKCMIAGCEPFMEEVLARAVDFMGQSPEVQKQIANAIDESLPQPPVLETADDDGGDVSEACGPAFGTSEEMLDESELMADEDYMGGLVSDACDTMANDPNDTLANVLARASMPIAAGMGRAHRPGKMSRKEMLKASMGFANDRFLRIGR